MRIPSQSEKVQAILDARQDVAEYLQRIGKIEAFANFTKDDICGLIRAAQEGVQKSLHRQMDAAFNEEYGDEIPF
jgi:BMFP domain-containing protein YqiC